MSNRTSHTFSILVLILVAICGTFPINARDWNDWQTYAFKDCVQNKSQNLLYGTRQGWGNDLEEGFGTNSQEAFFEIRLPLYYGLSPLKPFQEAFTIVPETEGRIILSFGVVTDFGEQHYSYQCLYSEYFEYRHKRFLLTYDISGEYTIGLERDTWAGEYGEVLKRFYNVKEIKPIRVTLQPNAMFQLFPIGMRDMTYDGIEQNALAYVHSYINQKNPNAALNILNRFIDDYKRTNSTEVYILRAMIHGELGNYESAISDATSAIQLSPSAEVAYYIRGVCLIEYGDFSGINDLKKAGQPGISYLKEHNLKDGDKPSVNSTNKLVPVTVLNNIPLSRKNVKLYPKQIYSRYNNSIFMIYNRGVDGTSQGSGFFIGKDGIAISNYHVFEGAIRGQEQVKLMNGGTYNVKEILGYDKEKDYIIFRVEGTGFTYIPITKRGYEIGDEVYAIGSPKGMTNTLSNGLISQKWDADHMQISVPIDHGSSGGALINQYGEVIGITSGGRDDSHANLNYAIDIRTIFNDNK